jgi:DNA modification methylase
VNDWLNKTHVGDCRELLPRMAADGVRVQTVVTSPPYFNLRDYGTGRWEGGDPTCEHGVRRWEGDKQTQGAQSSHASKADRLARAECRCGALRVDSQIGLERTPAEYVAALVTVFRAVREVLAEDGTAWINLGDSYAMSTRGAGGMSARQRRNEGSKLRDRHWRIPDSLKAKDLIGIPWRVAFALQEDGWYLRSDIIYEKVNPMPESVTDRPTKAHEYLFLLAKSERYYYDAESIKEPATHGGSSKGSALSMTGAPGQSKHAGIARDEPYVSRNRRSVWSIASEPFDGAHFACFPRKLIEPCILAGAPAGGIVLDVFHGSGTTGQTATSLGRQFIGIELSAEYVEKVETMRQATIGMAL